jgi:hypothetical protein
MPLHPDEIACIVHQVRAWRDRPVPTELRDAMRARDVTREERKRRRRQYWDEVARTYARPDMLAAWLAELRAAFGAAFPATAERDKQAVAQAVDAAAACGAYGPDEKVPTPNELAKVIEQAALGSAPSPQRLLERALVHGMLQREAPPPDWSHCWERAAAALMQMVRRAIFQSLVWIRGQVLRDTEWDAAGWVEREADERAATIRDSILQGCDCWKRWSEFGIETLSRGLYTCAVRHTLAAWDGEEELGRFLQAVAVQGELRDAARVNSFRKGILAKVVSPSLAAGRVLLCQHLLPPPPPPPGEEPAPPRRCHAPVRRDDRCGRQGDRHWGHVRKPDWWLWRKGTFKSDRCRRCAACGFLYFQSSGACPDPHCPGADGAGRWLPEPTEAWRPFRDLSLTGAPAGGAAAEDADTDERPGRVWAEVRRWRPGPERDLGERLYGRGMTLNEAAEDLGMDPWSNQFVRLTGRLVARLKQALNPSGGAPPPGFVRSVLADLRPRADDTDTYRAEIASWPAEDARSFAEMLLGQGPQAADEVGFAALAWSCDMEPHGCAFRRPLIEAVLRLALRPQRLQKLVEVKAVFERWPDGEERRAARRLFFPDPGDDGQLPADLQDRVLRRLAEDLARPFGAQLPPAEEKP